MYNPTNRHDLVYLSCDRVRAGCVYRFVRQIVVCFQPRPSHTMTLTPEEEALAKERALRFYELECEMEKHFKVLRKDPSAPDAAAHYSQQTQCVPIGYHPPPEDERRCLRRSEDIRQRQASTALECVVLLVFVFHTNFFSFSVDPLRRWMCANAASYIVRIEMRQLSESNYPVYLKMLKYKYDH